MVGLKPETDLKNDVTSLPYRRGVGITLINCKKQIFVGKRIDSTNNFWQMPQGGIEGDETTLDAAKRELFEETGVTEFQILKEAKNWLYYDLPSQFQPILYGGQYRGQKQKWFLFKFLGDEHRIKLDCHVQEFEEYKWVDFKEAIELVIPFKRQIYKRIYNEFKDAF